MSRWRAVVRWELHRYREQPGYDVVERQELFEQALPILERDFPDANTPGQTLSRVLQELRDRDELMTDVRDELADILIYSLAMANQLDLDLETIVAEKHSTC